MVGIYVCIFLAYFEVVVGILYIFVFLKYLKFVFIFIVQGRIWLICAEMIPQYAEKYENYDITQPSYDHKSPYP
jgi:hypothetical protein